MIAVLSDSPTLTTGFGRTTEVIAQALHDDGHQVACFGIKARPEDVGQTPYRVWPAEQGGHWTRTLPEFFQATRPRCLVVNMDAYNAVEVITAARTASYDGPVISYVVFDGLPVGDHFLAVQRSCRSSRQVLPEGRTGGHRCRDAGEGVVKATDPQVASWRGSGKTYQRIAAEIAEWARAQERGSVLPDNEVFARKADVEASPSTFTGQAVSRRQPRLPVSVEP
jgi:hypothetical protein